MKKLFIYIPTYRRPESLRAQLTRLTPQIQGESYVRIIVSDNAPPSDEMNQILDDFSGIPNLRFRRNPGNAGGNGNFVIGFCLAEPDEVLWILADDTLVEANCLAELQAAFEIDAGIYGLCHTSDMPEDFIFSPDIQGISIVLRDYSWGLLSSALYNMAYFSIALEAGFRFHNSSFPHLAILFDGARKNGGVPVHWIRRSAIHEDSLADPQADYSLSFTGMPQLFWLAPEWERRRLVRGWLRHYSFNYFQARSRFPENAAATTGILRRYGGISGRAWMMAGWAESAVAESPIGKRLRNSTRIRRTHGR